MKLKIEDITHSYPRSNGTSLTVIDSINLEVTEGSLLVILGPSGCGKTTLLRIISGLLTPTSGRVYLDGEPVHEPTKNIGMVFQDFTLFPWLTVYNNISFGLRINGVKGHLSNDIVEEYISLLGLKVFDKSFPKQLSEGMKQRVAIARSLAIQPQILLMDEPFSSLDVKTKWEMQELVLRIRDATGMTIVFVTHNVEEGLFLGDRVLILSARPSKIIEEYKVPFAVNRHESLKKSDDFVMAESRLTRIIRERVLQ